MCGLAGQDRGAALFALQIPGDRGSRRGGVVRACIVLMVGMLVISPVAVEADDEGPAFAVCYTATFPKDGLVFGKLMGYDTVRLEDAGCLNEAGRPMLPAQTLRIALPAGMAVTGVRVVGSEATTVAGQYDVFPAQPPRPMSETFATGGFVSPDPQVYASSEVYPAELVELVGQTDLAGQGIALLRVHPVQYVPAEKKLVYYTSIEIILEGVGGYCCGDYLPNSASASVRAEYEELVAGTVANPGDVELRGSDSPPGPMRGVGPGAYDYVIITQTSWVDDLQPLADWRTQAGVPTNIVTTDWIYNSGDYAGTNLEKVRAFIVDAHDTWGTMYFMLGGDSNVIPYHVRSVTVPGYGTHDIANDTYYADYDEDWSCEVHVSRAPVRSTTHIDTFVSKVLTYEKDPPLSDYAEMAAFFGFDITDPGDQDGEISKEMIRSLYLPGDWTLNTEYDAEPGTHRADVIAYLNQGHHLVNHHDHCDSTCMGTGWICHGDLLYVADVDALTNGDRQSIVFAVGCHPANFPTVTSIGEAFVRNPAGGAIAFMGNTHWGWGGGPEDPAHYTVLQDHLLYKSLFVEGLHKIGACFTYLKNGAYEGPDPYNVGIYCFTQLTLLGEPQLAVWTEQPQGLTVTHDDTLVVDVPTTFPVQVYGGGPVDQATVCLWKDGDVYEVEQTDSLGLATFGFTPTTTGDMYVTVVKHNYLPYEGSAEVDDCPEDLSGDGQVGLADLAAVLGNYNQTGASPQDGDFDGDRDVDLADLAQLLGVYGESCPTR